MKVGSFSVISTIFVSSLPAQLDSEFPLGIEAVTGLRSHYVERGFRLAESALEFQLASELTLSNETALGFGLSHLAESAGDFAETSAYLDYQVELTNRLGYRFSATFRDRRESVLSDGLDFGFHLSYELNDAWIWESDLHYDFGEEGFYASTSLVWSLVFSEHLYLEVENSLSAVSGYPTQGGLNDFESRATLNYLLSDQISIAAFLGHSLQLSDRDRDDTLYAGLWFQVIF